MSFFETLKQYGLWPQQGQAPSQQDNPYGLDAEMMRQARMQSLSNIGAQIMAASVKQTPRQRADLMSQFDPTGGYQNNLMNAAQMKLAQRRMQKDDLETQRAEEIRKMVADRIKATPPGRLRDAAMFYFQAGDLSKAGEVLFSQSQRFNPMTGEMEAIDGMGNPIAGAPPVPGGVPAVGGESGAPSAPTPPAVTPAAPGAVPPMPLVQGEVDQLTTNWRRLLNDPSLTPTEARIIASQGSQKGAYDKYAEIVKNREAQANNQASQDQTVLQGNRTAADALTDAYDASTKSYDTIIGAGQRAAQVASNSQMSPSAKLSTLYQFMKALDPDGAVREGDVAMAQSMQSVKDQWLQFAESQLTGGGPISEAMVMDMAREMSRLANDAAGRKELKRIQLIRRADGRQIPRDMVVDPGTGSQNMQAPIGIRIPRQTSREDAPVTLDQNDESLIQGWQ